MKIFKIENVSKKWIVFFYFANAVVEDIAEFFSYKPVLFVFKPLGLIILMYLYWYSSTRRSLYFFVICLFLLITKVYIIYNSEEMLFIGMLAFLLHRIVMIYYIAKLIQLKDYIPLFIVMIPFLSFFLYLLSITSGLTIRNYYTLILQSILMSALAGMTLSYYAMNNDRKGVWLLIFGLLSIVQYFIVFIDKFYLQDLCPVVFRPILVILTTFACFTFYKFVVTTEKLSEE